MNYFELYPGDYRRDTARLTLAEHGAYLLLMADYYASETPLPAELATLCRIVGAQGRAEQKAVETVAQLYFPVGADGLRHNSRADRELAKAQKRISTARANGSKGGRKPKPGKNPLGNPPGYPAGYPVGGPEGTRRGGQRPTHSGEALHTPHAIHQTAIQTSPSANRSTGAEALARALQGLGFEHCSPGHPELVAAAQAGVTEAGMAAAALGHSDKSITYIARRAVGQLRDAAAAQASQPTSTAAASPRINPDVAAERDWRLAIEAEIADIRHQCDTLGVIDSDARDQRIHALRQTLAAGWPGRPEGAR